MRLEAEEVFYYMRDNHTFRRLDSDIATALVQIEEELEAGWTSGMLCSSNSGTPTVHSDYKRDKAYFLKQCRELMQASGNNIDVSAKAP